MSDSLDLTAGDVHLLLARCFDAPECPKVIQRLEFSNGEIPVVVELGGIFHHLKVVRIIESDFDFVVCVAAAQAEDSPVGDQSTLTSNRILKHAVKRVVYQ